MNSIVSVAAEPTIAAIEKTAVADSFSRAAARYDQYAKVQQRIAAELLRGLQQRVAQPVGSVLDLGAGTGAWAQPLQHSLSPDHYLGLDLAEGMVRYAKSRPLQNSSFVVADAESLPLSDASVDLVFSSLALQWLPDLSVVAAELSRVVAPGGWIAIATLGPHTLYELRDAWSAVDAHPHVNEFLPLASVRAALAPLGRVEYRVDRVVDRHRDLRAVFASLREVGARNLRRDRATALTGPRRLRAVQDAYEPRRSGGFLPLTYEVYFLWIQRHAHAHSLSPAPIPR